MTNSDKVKIMIADDEASLRLLVKATLQPNSNFEFIEACDGDEAWDLSQKEKPKILILDVMMPGLSGFEVCEKIKNDENLKDIIIIMLTAKGQQTDKDWAKSVGADHFMTKPFSPMELLDLVNRCNA